MALPTKRLQRPRGHLEFYLGLLVLAVSAALAVACGRSEAPHTSRQERFFGAVALGLFGHPDDPAMAAEDMAEIARLGATGIVLPVFWSSRDVASTSIEPFHYGVPREAYDRAIVEIASRAHSRGLAFEVLPIVRLEHLAPGDWRGTLRPADWDAWWDSYRRFILHQAVVAERAGAEIFCVGSELGSTESQTDRWTGLIADVRRLTRAKLLYSANWDHYGVVEFWDRLDAVGMSAYHELASAPGASQDELDNAWRRHRDAILAWARPIGKPLYLTEVGYPAQSAAAVHPWDYTRRDAPDPEAQARCFRAFAAAWRDVPELGGVTVWIWDHGKGGPVDDSYAIEGKPAADVVKSFFEARTETAAAPRAR